MKLYLRSKKDVELKAEDMTLLLSMTMKYNQQLKSLGIQPIITFKFEK